MGGLRSSGTNTLGLRERHKYVVRQGPLDRREKEEEEGEEGDFFKRKNEYSWADLLQGGRQRFGAGPYTRTRMAEIEKKGSDKIRRNLNESYVDKRLLQIVRYKNAKLD